MNGPAIYPAAEIQREATHAERRGARVNRRHVPRSAVAAGEFESVAQAQARYTALGLQTTTPADLRDNGSRSPAEPPRRPPVDRHVTPSDAAAERERASEVAERFGFQP